jgi:hypothetical protein
LLGLDFADGYCRIGNGGRAVEPSDAADSKQLHTAKASADGLLAAYPRKRAHGRVEDPRRRGGGLARRVTTPQLTDGRRRWALAETPF